MRFARTFAVLVLVAGAGAPTVTAPASAWSTGQAVFHFTGRAQAWMAPQGVTSVHVDVQGAPGSWYGASGGRVEAVLAVRPGQRYLVYVGGQSFGTRGGWNGGASAGAGCKTGLGGGGASDIRYGGAALRNRIVVAGGGGGGGPGGGGLGGQRVAENGKTGRELGKDTGGGGGGGGKETQGGAGGVPHDGLAGKPGTLGQGGAGGRAMSGHPGGCGNGGGGGYYGGGGGASAKVAGGGGGGGSSYTEGGVTEVVHTAGYNHGRDGLVVIGWGDNQAPRAPRLVTPSRGSHVSSSDLSFSIVGDDPDWDNVVGDAEVTDVITGLVVTTFTINAGQDLGERSGVTMTGFASSLPDGNYRWRVRTRDVNRYSGQWGAWSAASPFVVGAGSPVCNNTAVLPDC